MNLVFFVSCDLCVDIEGSESCGMGGASHVGS